jgi:formylglycine-generating enzyme required for sulfatase activity
LIREAAVVDSLGERRIPAATFPLSVGGEGAAIACEGVGAAEVVAHLGLEGGHAFLRPATAAAAVIRNGEAVDDAVWLAHGDRIEVGRACIDVAVVGPVLSLVARRTGEAPATGDVSPQTPRIALRARPSGSRSLRLALLAAFAVLLCAALAVFVSGGVSVQVTPAPDGVRVTGALPAVALGTRYLVLPGPYRVRVEKAGYRTVEAPVEVARGGHVELSLALEKLPGRVRIATTPEAGVRLYVDGEILGETPLDTAAIDAGSRRLRAEAHRYQPWEGTIEVEGMGRGQHVAVDLIPAWAVVSLRSVPPGAEVWIDGNRAGTTPLTTDLLDGEHAVQLRKQGYRTVDATVGVVANEAQEVPPFVLEEADATLRVETEPPGASVTLDGRFTGRAPLELDLRPRRRYAIRASRAGHADATHRVELDPEERRTLRLTLAPRTGVVFVTVDPPDALLLVDGTPLGPATGRHEVSATRHEIVIQKEGYVPHRTTLSPRANAVQRLDVVLQSTLKALPARLRTGEGQAMVLVRPGRVRMGASRREPGARANEALRDVALKRPFYVALHEVTNAQYRRFTPSHTTRTTAGVAVNAEEAPVAGVTWAQAARYLNWLSRKDALPPAYEERGDDVVPIHPPTTGYRLPSEAEWAFVARKAGRAGEAKYPWGGAFPPLAGAGNYADLSARGVLPEVIAGYDDGFAGSAPVGRFDANPVGVFDLGGNVAEWCHDWYAARPEGAGQVDPLGPAKGRHHVVRGSSWRDASISELRLSRRDYSDAARDDLGFRFVRYAQ